MNEFNWHTALNHKERAVKIAAEEERQAAQLRPIIRKYHRQAQKHRRRVLALDVVLCAATAIGWLVLLLGMGWLC